MDVAMVDIPGTFLTTYMDDYFIMVLRGRLSEVMMKIEPRICRKFVRIENGRMVLYVKL